MKLQLLFYSIIISLLPIRLIGQESVIISEIMYDTPLNEKIAQGVDYSNGEYIELYNVGDTEVNLAGWQLKGGGTSEIFTFWNGVTMPPNSYIIVAYQHNDKNTKELFYLNHLYTDLYSSPPNYKIYYQKKIILSNSGESVVLKDKSGITRDSIFYHGTSGGGIPNSLEAWNKDHTPGYSCYSLQRINVKFNASGVAIPSNLDWVADVVTPFKQHSRFKNPFEEIPVDLDEYTKYSYDLSGNIIGRKTITFQKPVKDGRSFDEKQERKVLNDIEVKLKIYPNPTTGQLYIEIPDLQKEDKILISLYDTYGVLHKKQYVKESYISYNISNYRDGVYILNINRNGTNSSWKIIKK